MKEGGSKREGERQTRTKKRTGEGDKEEILTKRLLKKVIISLICFYFFFF